MMAELPIWWDYLIFDDEWSTNTLREDTPQHISKEFEEFQKWQKENPDVMVQY